MDAIYARLECAKLAAVLMRDTGEDIVTLATRIHTFVIDGSQPSIDDAKKAYAHSDEIPF